MSVTTNIVDSKKVSRNQNKSLNFNALGERGTAAVTLYRAFPDGTPDPKPVEHTTLEAFLAMIQSQDQIEASEKLTELYSNYLGCKEKKDKDVAKKSYDVAKKQLPGFALGNLTYRSDDESNFYEYVPCMGFDLDGCMSEYHRFEFQHFLKGLPYVYATFPSANGHGLRILVWTAATYESHRLIYNQILDELCKFLKLTTNKKDGTYFDSTCQNESRFFYFKQVKKNDFYLNPNSEIFVSKLENNVITMLTANEPKPMPDTVASIVEKTPDTLPTAMFENTDYAYVDEINDYLKMDILMRNIDTNQPRKIQCFNFGCVCRENNVDFDNAKTFALKEFWDAENKNPEKIIQAQLKDGYAQSVVKWTDQQFEAYIGKRYKIKVIKNEPELELQKLKDKVYDGAVKVHDDLLKLNNAVALGEILENLNSAAPMDGDEPSSSNEKVAVFDILTTLKNYREELPAGKSESFYLQKLEKIAASLLAKEKDDNVYLVKDIAKSFKLDAKSLAKQIKSEKQHLAAQQAPEVDTDDRTAEEKLCFHKYMFWERDNCYHSMVNGRTYVVSNFCVTPIMLIINHEESQRIVRITNKQGRSHLIPMKSTVFVDMKAFKSNVSKYGNYVIKGYDNDMFENIVQKIYDEMPEAYAINTLGLHKMGFYSWGNGITKDGKFNAVDKNGMVTYDNCNYFLPAFSDMSADLQQEDEFDFEDEKKFVYCSDNQSIAFKEWTKMMIEIYGEKGMMGVAYYCAALYRDIVYNYLGYFPHLNLFGQSGSGKSWMAQSITAMFGFRIPPFHLVHGTNVGFFRRLSKIQNGISWFDEYSNDVSIQRVEAMKAAYDGNGHEKAGTGQNVMRTKVKSALIIAGQKHMTKDIALFKRTISLNFALADQTPEREAAGKALKEIENTGVLSQLTVQAMSFRNEVKENFRDKFTAIRKFVSKDITAEERTINNHIVPLAITAILMDHLDFAFTKKQLTDFIINNIRVQSDNMSKEDETAGWWKMIQFLAESDLLKCGLDYMVQMKHQITVLADNKRIATKVVDFERQPVLFLRFERAHPLYMQYSKMQFGVNGLPQSSLEYYLRGEKYFLGEVKTKRFVNESKGCFAFKFSPYINLPETPKILEKKDILLKS